MTTHYVVADCEAVTEAYLRSGYKLSTRTVLEQLGANLYKLLTKETRAGLTVLEIDEVEHAKNNSPERANRPIYTKDQFITGARIELVDVLERGPTASVVAPVIDGGSFNESYATGECDTYDLVPTEQECFDRMAAVVRRAIDKHLDAIGELRKFLETKH